MPMISILERRAHCSLAFTSHSIRFKAESSRSILEVTCSHDLNSSDIAMLVYNKFTIERVITFCAVFTIKSCMDGANLLRFYCVINHINFFQYSLFDCCHIHCNIFNSDVSFYLRTLEGMVVIVKW